MAISKEPLKVLDLIKSGNTFCAKFTDRQKELVKRFVGNWYRTDAHTEPSPENMLLAYQASVVPQLAFDNPAVKIKANRPITGKEIASWLQQGMNQWIQLRDIQDDLELAAVDSLYSFAVLKVGVEPIHHHTPEPGQDEVQARMPAHLPFLVHVPNTDYCFDPEAKKWEYRRWEAMRMVRDLEDVQNDESYDEQARATVQAAYDPKSDKGRLYALEQTADAATRVELFEVFFNETKEIGVLCETGKQGAVWLRKPEKHHGPGSPYVLIGGYYVPGSPIPAAVLALTADQFNELNAHATSAAKEEKSRKTFIIANGDNPANNAAIRRVENGGVLEIKGFDPRNVANMEIGGTSSEKIQFIGYLRDRLDSLMGMSDATRGKAQGVTATEAGIAQDNASIRIQLLQRHWRRGVREALSKVCWYLFNDPAVVFSVAFEDPESGEETEGYFMGGVQPGQEDMDWTQHQLSIEPMSMKRVDPQEQAQIAKMTLDVAMAIAPMIPQYPWIRWRVLLDTLGEAHNIEGFADQVMDEQALVQAMVMGMVAPIPPSGQASQASVPANANPQLRGQFPTMGGGMQQQGRQPMAPMPPSPRAGDKPTQGPTAGAA